MKAHPFPTSSQTEREPGHSVPMAIKRQGQQGASCSSVEGLDRRRTMHLVGGRHRGLVGHVVGPSQLLDGFGRHGLGEPQATPGICRRSDLSHYWLL